MKWAEVKIETAQEAIEAISHILHDASASGVVIEDPAELKKERVNVYGEMYALNEADYPTEGVIVKAYFLLDENLDQILEGVKERILELKEFGLDIGKAALSTSEVDEEEWANAWKKYYHPVQVTDRFTIVPTWETYEPASEQEMIIELDPGMAFGTGTHPTTAMCMQAVQDFVKPGDEVVDVGTGSGVLSVAAAMLGAKQVFAYDLDEVAVHSARENIEGNKVEGTVSVGKSNLLSEYQGKADVVIGNLLAEIVIMLSPQVKPKLKDGGTFIMSGIIESRRQEVVDQITKDGFEIVKEYKVEDWICICAK